MSRLTKFHWILATTLLVLLVSASTTAAGSSVKVLPTADPGLPSARAKPSAVEWLMTGDFMTRLRWRHWGRSRTTATGRYHLNRCDPSCATGPYERMRGKV